MDKLVPKDNRVQQEYRVNLALQDLKDYKDHRGHKANLVHLVQQDLQDLLDYKALLAPRDNLEPQVHKDRLVQQGRQDSWETRVSRAQRELQGVADRRGCRALQGLQVNRVRVGQLEAQVQLDRRVALGAQVLPALLVNPGCQEIQDHLVQVVNPVHQDSKATRDLLAPQDLRDPVEFKARLVAPELQDLLEEQEAVVLAEQQVQLDSQVNQACLDKPAAKATLDGQGSQDL